MNCGKVLENDIKKIKKYLVKKKKKKKKKKNKDSH